MAYLRNAWYVAGWSNEIGEGLFSARYWVRPSCFSGQGEGRPGSLRPQSMSASLAPWIGAI